MKFSKAIFDKYSQKIKTIAFDLDGTIAEYEGYESYQDGVVKPPLPNTIEVIKGLKDVGYEIIIFTARGDAENKDALDEWLDANGLTEYIDDIIFNKPHYDLLVDDKNLNFSNESAGELLNKIKEFKPWWEKDAV